MPCPRGEHPTDTWGVLKRLTREEAHRLYREASTSRVVSPEVRVRSLFARLPDEEKHLARSTVGGIIAVWGHGDQQVPRRNSQFLESVGNTE